MQDNAVTNHINTRPIAYNIEVAREWLFEQLT
jgi:predicted peptidase